MTRRYQTVIHFDDSASSLTPLGSLHGTPHYKTEVLYELKTGTDLDIYDQYGISIVNYKKNN